MKKIVLVDDEQEVRRSISHIIDWSALGFELVGEASNGQEALGLIEETHPDVVLTDIKMPIMDGLTLGHEIRKFDPTIKIIFLSGYDNFDYAQSAIRLNVFAYLLKPISVQDLEEVMLSVSQAIEVEKQNAHDIMKLTKEYMRSLDELRRGFLLSLINESFTLEDEGRLRNIAALYQLELSGQQLMVINIALQEAQGWLDDCVTTETKDLIFSEELHWVSYTTTIKEIAKQYVEASVFRVNNILTLIVSTDTNFFDQEIDTMLVEIEQSFLRHYDRKVMIGLSQVVSKLREIQRAYRQAMDALNYCRLFPEYPWVYISDIERNIVSSEWLDEQVHARILSHVKLGDTAMLDEELMQVQEQYVEQYHTRGEYFAGGLELIVKAIRIYRQFTPEVDQYLINRIMDDLMASRYDMPGILMRKCREYLQAITRQIQANRQEQKESLTAQGIQLIQEHYADPNFSQKQLATMLHISPNYLSGLFTKKTGKSFKDHLIAIRMQKAQDLLLRTDLRVLEVAQLCGYTDQHYFSYGFKKYFGQSPRNMRESRV